MLIKNGKRFAVVAGLAAILFPGIIAIHHRVSVRGSLIALLDFPYTLRATSSPSSPVEAKLVAHAGGAVRGLTYTNSREALDGHYATGYRVFELDFDWTSDGKLVLVHDWVDTSLQFGVQPHVFKFEEFISGTRRDGLHQMTFEDLHQWMRTHPDALVVTDTKASNSRLLSYLRANGGEIRPTLIVQIYKMSELRAARQLGPRAVWLTVYKYGYPAGALSRISGVDAFVIPVGSYDRYRNALLMERVHYYVQSVPAQSVDETFRTLPGIYGIYVD